MTFHTPSSETEAASIIAAASAERSPIEIVGGGSKHFGAPVQAAATLSSSRLTGITLYEPAELVIAARAGTPVEALVAALDDKGQMLAFEPPDWRTLLGTQAATPTVGGLVAANLSGPRRIMSGACRDALIGVRFINGRGEALSSGGRVMKNVTGYDLVKLMAGSHGTLGLITEVTFKLVPKPETSVSLVWQGLDVAKAVELMSAALGSPFEVSGAAHLPGTGGAPSRTLVRLENFAASIAYRRDALARELKRFGACDSLDDVVSRGVWMDIRDLSPLVPARGPVWRVSLAPSKTPAFLAAIEAYRLDSFLDWGGGLVFLATEDSVAAGEAVRTAARQGGGHATLIGGSEMLRRNMAFMPSASAGIARLSAGLQAAFDPAGILNPGRMGD